MARSGPRKVNRYGEQFKATAVKLSSLPGALIQDVAAALDIQPFMLSLWRKQVRDGVIVARPAKLDVQTAAELKRLRALERKFKERVKGVRLGILHKRYNMPKPDPNFLSHTMGFFDFATSKEHRFPLRNPEFKIGEGAKRGLGSSLAFNSPSRIFR